MTETHSVTDELHAGNKPSAADVTKDAEEEGWSLINSVAGMQSKAAYIKGKNVLVLMHAALLNVVSVARLHKAEAASFSFFFYIPCIHLMYCMRDM